MRHAFDSCGRRVVDYGMGYVPAGGLGVTLNQSTINQATARVMNEGTELAIASSCPAGSQAFPAGQPLSFTCWTGYTRGPTTILPNGIQCVPPCVPVTSKANAANARACMNAISFDDPLLESKAKKCRDENCFYSLTPQANSSCAPSSAKPGTYYCCD